MDSRVQQVPQAEIYAAASGIANSIADSLDADVVFFNGSLHRDVDRRLIELCARRRRRKNVFLMLVTHGGDPNVAFRIARCLQVQYSKFTLFVSGLCKSAGTLIATGAHDLVVSDHGELGPLDVQMSKKDELWESQSGLILMDTLSALQDNALENFERFPT